MKSATATHLHRVRQVPKSQLNGKNKVQAFNTYTLPVIRYTACIISWSKEEIEATDVKTREGQAPARHVQPEKAGLEESTEARIMAAQEQALRTRSLEAGVYRTRQDPRCRLYKDTPETVQHIIAGCKM